MRRSVPPCLARTRRACSGCRPPVRLFVAIEIPESWREAARLARTALERETRAPLRWVDPALMHLTLRFLGEVAEERLGTLRRALGDTVPPVDVELTLDGTGTFGPPVRTSAVWLGVGGDGEALRVLAGRVEAAVVAAGLPSEERPLSAHITLARVSRRATRDDRRAVAEAVTLLPSPPPSSFRARSVTLVQSHLGRGGPRYQALSRHG